MKETANRGKEKKGRKEGKERKEGRKEWERKGKERMEGRIEERKGRKEQQLKEKNPSFSKVIESISVTWYGATSL